MRRLAAPLGGLLLGSALLLGRGAAVPDVAVACSCMGPQPLAAYAGEQTAIFSGEVVGDDANGVRIAVQQWFSGTGAAPVVLLSGDFGNGASCGLGARPPVGSSWLAVAWRPTDEGVPDPLGAGFQVNICQPFAELSTPEGADLLEEAFATFGDGEAPAGTPAAPIATPEPSAVPGRDGPSTESVALAAAVGVTGLGLLIFVGVLLVGRRGRPGQPE